MVDNQPGNKPKRHGFQPGQSGNPKGRPKGRGLTELLQARARKEGKTLVDVLWDAACKDRDMRAMAMIWDRVEGKVPDKVEVAERISREEFVLGLKSRIGIYESATGGNGHANGTGDGAGGDLR